MSAKPTICCVMLVNGREAMTRRAIASFRAQTYHRKFLFILETAGRTPVRILSDTREVLHILASEEHADTGQRLSVGHLRNAACGFPFYSMRCGVPDLFAHWDSDDWSHPRRLEEQVALLESTGKQCVGYRELLFWDTRELHERPNQAWLYRNDDPRWAAGASFLYRRELWERQPFDDAPHEDQRWWLTPLVSSRCVGTSALVSPNTDIMPRMICQIHGTNTEAYDREKMLAGAQVWRRAPEYDHICAERMKL